MCILKLQIILVLKIGGKNMRNDEMPVGFAMALAMNPSAMQKFSTFDEAKKKEIIDGTHAVNSRDEMHRYVASLVNDKV